MSIKRQATTELNHDNWDQDDPTDSEEMGVFKTAPKEVLEKRVIRTAKRRSQASGDEAKKSVFSGFGGFNKTQPSSFNFLANLTNGNKTNGTSTSKSETTVSSGLFSSKPAGSPSSGLFSTLVTSSPASKPTFGNSTASTSLFSGTNSTISPAFPTSKPVTTTSDGSPFKMTMPGSTTNASSDVFKGTSNTSKSPFSTNNTKTPVFNVSNTFGTSKMNTENNSTKKPEEKLDDSKMKYYSKLKGLNESVSDWIKKHVEETPLCILTPIFKDYEKHLKEIQEEYQGSQAESKKPKDNASVESSNTLANFEAKNQNATNNSGSTLFSNSNTKPSIFGNNTATSNTENTSGFSFGIKTTPTSAASSGGFSFGISSAPQTTTATSPPTIFSTPNTSSGSNGPAPFSFSSDKPFSFSSNITQKPAETANEDKEDEDEPPKVEFAPIVEENSVFDKKCKIFVKKDGNFADLGVGTLYIKKIEENGKYQLLVRANTSLGNILLNLILSSSIPTQRLGKNNVMLVCIPTTDAKPPPTPVLIRVKTSEEADELLEILNKYKV